MSDLYLTHPHILVFFNDNLMIKDIAIFGGREEGALIFNCALVFNPKTFLTLITAV